MKPKTFLKSAIAGFTAFAMVTTMLPANNLSHVKAASTDDNMILHWDMTIDEDGSLKDVTDNNHNGVITGAVQPATIDGIKVVEMSGSDTSNPGYVTIPNGTITSDMTELTINMLVKTTKNNSGNWMWTIGSNHNRYLYFTGCCSSNQGSKMRGGACYDPDETNKGWNFESVITGETAITENEWQNMTVTYKDNGEFIFYKNGELEERTTLSEGNAGTFNLQQLMTADDEYDGYMGHSFYDWNGDPDFQGKVADFRIYNKEMSQTEVTELYAEIDARLQSLASGDFSASDVDLDENDCLGTNADKNSIETNLVLPSKTTINGDTTAANAATITKWTSSDPSVIADDGTVTRPTTNKTVTMTATIARKDITVEKTLTFRVLRNLTDQETAQLDLDTLYLNKEKDDIRGNIYLATEGENGSKITWTSSDENIISSKANGNVDAGKVNRAANKDSKVILTATATINGATATKTFDCTVKKAYTTPETTDYIFAYFPYTNTKDERIYFGVSEDGLNFSALNDSQFVLESKLGTHGLRDPFIIRSHEGDRFFLIATDLTVAGIDQDDVHYPAVSWDKNQTEGSQKIMVWESTDLVNWSEQRECKVAADNAGCAWAPEAYWDDETEQYVVFWASKTSDDNYGNQRLYYATTRDFRHFSKAQVWIDEAGSVIDTTVIKVGEYYYRYTKNEAGNDNKYETPSKRVYCERSKSLTSTEWEFVHNNSLNVGGGQIEGPCILKLNKDDVENAKYIASLKGFEMTGDDIYCLMADATGSTIFPGLSDDITTGSFNVLGTTKAAEVDGIKLYSMPEPDASHGTVMPITSEEYNNLRLKYDAEYALNAAPYIEQVKTATAGLSLPTTKVSSDLTLPTTAANGATITWASSNETIIGANGKVNRPTYKQGDATVTLTATITVVPSDGAVRDQIRTKTFDVTVEKLAQPVYTVSFNSDGGSSVKAQSVKDGNKAAAPANPTKKGYTFAGWYNGNTKYNFNSAVTGNLTLKAKWSKVTVKAPSKLTLKNKKSKQMAITIKKVSGAAGYQVSYSTSKKFTKKTTKTKDITKNTLTVKKLKKGKTYYVKVKAFKKDSKGSKVYSTFSKVSKIKIKK